MVESAAINSMKARLSRKATKLFAGLNRFLDISCSSLEFLAIGRFREAF
jgi:hypothetical protein